MNTYTAIDPNGVVHTRNSKRVFTHVVFAIPTCEPTGYLAVGWAGSLALGEKLLHTTRNARYPRPGTKGRLIYDGRLTYTDACLVNV
jgi:hypothetical protein